MKFQSDFNDKDSELIIIKQKHNENQKMAADKTVQQEIEVESMLREIRVQHDENMLLKNELANYKEILLANVFFFSYDYINKKRQ